MAGFRKPKLRNAVLLASLIMSAGDAAAADSR